LVKIDSTRTAFDHRAVAYVGDSICNLSQVAEALVQTDFSQGGVPRDGLYFPCTAGASYQLSFDSLHWADGGNIDFVLELIPQPINDNFANRQVLSGVWASASANNTGASAEPGEIDHVARSAERSIWWEWTAPTSPVPGRPVVFSTAGSSFDTVLAVYTSASAGGLVLVTNNNNDPLGGVASTATFIPVPGTAYQIVVDGNRSGDLLAHRSGEVRLTLDYSTLQIATAHVSDDCGGIEPCDTISGQLSIRHFGDAPTKALRVSLVASNGYSKSIGYAGTRDTSTVLLHAPISLPAPGILLPNGIAPVSYASVSYPPPQPAEISSEDASSGNGFARGWGIYAVLEEQFGEAWLPVDSTLIRYGRWPRVGEFVGPNGGVIRSDPTRPAPNLLFDIAISGPRVLCESDTAQISGRAMFILGNSNAQPDWHWTGPLTLSTNGLQTNAVITVAPLTAPATATISASLDFSGGTVRSTANLTVSLRSDCPEFQGMATSNNVVTLYFTASPGKRVAIDYADALAVPTFWFPLQTSAIPTASTLIISYRAPTNTPKRFYRAREVP
jgi:hypothetical protein